MAGADPVSKVIFHGVEASRNADSKHPNPCVLKIYDAEALIGRMERELEACFRVAQLGDGDQKRFARLVAFGALDLEDVDPRLFIATEYIESQASNIPYEMQKHQLDKVVDTLKSVGVYHNDLEERNFKWQLEDGEWVIKVLDFYHATFDDGLCKSTISGFFETPGLP